MNIEQYRTTENSPGNIGLYKIITPSGKIYIGMTTDSFSNRWNNHYKKLRANTHHCAGLQNSYNKYGWDNLNKIIIEEFIKPIVAEDMLLLHEYILKREVELWDEYKRNGIVLNGRPTGTGSVNHTEETKERLKLISNQYHNTICAVYFVNCVLCNKLFCARGASAKYCSVCKVSSKNKNFNNQTKILDSKICANNLCCNFIIGKKKYCSKQCDNRIVKNVCEYCGRVLNNKIMDKNIKRYCNSKCQNNDRHKNIVSNMNTIVELFNNGKSYRGIAVIVGCSHQTVSNYIKKYKENN